MKTLSLLTAGAALAIAMNPSCHAEPVKEIPLRAYVAGLRTVQMSVAGHTGQFIFDSAGGLSLITPEFSRAIGAEPFGQITAFRHDGELARFRRVRAADITIAGTRLPLGELAEFDLMKMLEGAPAVQGLVALDAFQNAAVTIDFAGNRLLLESKSSLQERTKEMIPLRLRVARQSAGAALDVFVAVDAPRGPIWLELDCGNAGPIILAPHAAAQLGTALGTERKDISLRLAPGLDYTAAAVVKDTIYDGLLNANFFHEHIVTFHLRTGRGWARRVRGDARDEKSEGNIPQRK